MSGAVHSRGAGCGKKGLVSGGMEPKHGPPRYNGGKVH
jgi:hypothetical protein